MGMDTLANRYRPKDFNEVVSQKSVVHILERQVETGTFKNVYLFAGPSGCGKTTLAKILANKINKGEGKPIEIDAASHNGVDNIRTIIEEAKDRDIYAEYKIIILDEAHALSNSAQQALLKCLEKPPMYTIFILCTTDPQKLSETILNRTQRFNLTKINIEDIANRLRYICEQEKFTNYEEAVMYIARMSSGGMRYAISLLDKASAYSRDLSIENVVKALGDFNYTSMFELTDYLVDRNVANVMSILTKYYEDGNDFKLFIEQYLSFVLDIFKYCIFRDISATTIPSYLLDRLNYTVGFSQPEPSLFFSNLLNKLLQLKIDIKGDPNIYATIMTSFINYCRGV